MNLGTLTTTQAIRAVLGVSEDSDELPDQIFTDLEISDQIELLIEEWLPVTILSIIPDPVPPETEVVVTTRVGKALKACAKYTGALILIPSLTTATASMLSDGQDQFKRQDRDLKALEEALRRALEDMKKVVLDELAEDYEYSPAFFGSAAPTFDPVTGA